MGWIVYSKDGQTERCVLHKLEYSGTFMGDRSVIATFSSEKKIDFNVFDYITYRGERFELELLPTVKKVSSREYKYELRFVSLKYELERCMMRNIVPGDNGIVYPTPLTIEFTGDVKYLAERIQACLDAMYGKGTWNITIAEGTESEEKNISMSNQNCWGALSIVNTEYKLNYFIKGRNVIIGGEEPVVDNVFEYGKGKGLYEIERISDTDTGVVTKLRAYGGTRNLDYSYPKLPEWTDSVLPANYALSPLRLMLPSFKTDGKTDYVLASEEAIAKYGIREGVITYDDIYPSITGMKNSAGQAIDEIKSVSAITSDTQSTFTVGLYDLGFDLSDSLTTDEAQLSMKSGSLQGYTFNITKIEKASDGSYTLTLGRNTLEEGDTGNFTVPNKDWNMKTGDKFVLLNILMPQEYIRDAENRLLARAKEYLAKYSSTNYSYNVGVDEIFMARNVNFYNDIMEGKRLTVNDQEIGINNENIIIQSLTIKEGEGIIPTFEVTLNNETTASTLDRIQGQISEVETSVNNNFSSQSELLKQYRKKLDKSVWDSIFVIHKNDPQNPEKITSVQSLVGLWTDEFLSSKGLNPGSGGGSGEGGATALYQLNDIAKNASETGVLGAGPGKVLTYGTDGKWYAADAIGLDETALGEYLTDNNYAKKSDIPSLSGYATQAWVNTTLGSYATTASVNSALDNKVDKISGMGLSQNNFTDALLQKLNGIAEGANKYILPAAKAAVLGGVMIGSTLTASATGVLNLPEIMTAGTYAKVTTDIYGRVTGGSSLSVGDIPALGISKITGLQDALDKKVSKSDFATEFDKAMQRWFVRDTANKGLHPADYNSEAVGIYSDSYVSSKGVNTGTGGGTGGASSLGELNNVGSWADEIPTVDRIMVQRKGATHWESLNLSDIGLNESQLSNYLTTNNYAKKSDIPSLAGYATENWVLGKGYITSASLTGYATQSWVNTQLGSYATSSALQTVSDKLDDFLTGADTDDVINKWKELEDFLTGFKETDTLADALSLKADKTISISAGTGLSGGGNLTANRTISLKVATTEALGGIKVGDRLSIDTNGVLSATYTYTLPTASATVLGGVKVGTTLAISSGVLNLKATGTAGTYFKVTTDAYGRVTSGSNPTTLSGFGITDGFNTVAYSGSGNAITSATFSGHTLTLVKGTTFLTKATFDDLFEKVNIGTTSAPVYAIKAKYGLYTEQFLSSMGLNTGTGGGSGSDYDRLDAWADYDASKAGWVLSAGLGNDLNTRMTNLEGGAAVTVTPSGTGSVVTGVTKSGTVITVTKGNLAFGSLTGKPTTLSGYGITDAVTLTTPQEISGQKTFSNSIRLSNKDIQRVNAATGTNATGSWWRTANYATTIAGVGCLTIDNANPRLFMGWSEAPWELANSLTVSSTSLTYKNNAILHAGNYNTYAPTKTGTGASGTWGISITGNAATATKLGTARTITVGNQALTFDGTANITFTRNAMSVAYGKEASYSATTTADGWYRIAVSSKSIVNNNGIFTIIAAALGCHTVATINASISYGRNPSITQLGCSHYSNIQIKAVRLVWHDSYTDNYAYLEIQTAAAIATSIGVKIVGGTGWNIYTSATAGSVPSGYSSKSLTLGSDSIRATTFVGALTGNAGSATKLQTARTIFGKSFDGSANVAGQAFVYGNYTATAANRYSNGGIQVRENGLVGSAQTDDGYAPAIGFHWQSKIAASLIMSSAGNFKFLKQNFTDYAPIYAGQITAQGSYLRAVNNGNTVQIGSQNTTYAHFTSSKPFWFGNGMEINGYCYPYTNNSFTLGNASKRWSGIYGTVGDFSSYIQIGSIRLTYDSANNAIKVSKSDGTAAGLYAVGFISSMGLATGTGGGGGGSDYDRLDNWSDYTADKAGYVLSAKLGNDLNTRVKSLEGGSALTVTTTGSGNAVTSVTKSGTAITVTKGATFLTSHQSLANYVTLNSAQTITAEKTWAVSQKFGNSIIRRINSTTANNASGTHWYTNDYAAIQFGIGVYTEANANPRAYIGWTATPWQVSTNLTVSSTQLTYKGNNILHAANYNDYAPSKTGTGASGTWGISITGNAATVGGFAPSKFMQNFASSSTNLNDMVTSGVYRTTNTNANLPSSTYNYSQVLVLHGGNDTIGQLAMSYSQSGRMAVRSGNPTQVGGTGTWGAWNTVAFTTDNVASATKLQTARTIWGQSFNGTANVSGNLTSVGHIQFSANASYNIGTTGNNASAVYARTLQSNSTLYLVSTAASILFKVGDTEAARILGSNYFLGLGVAAPTQKLDVAGNVKATGYFYSGGWFENNAANKGLYNSVGDARWYWNGTGWYADKAIISSSTIQGTQLKSTIAAGTAPLTVVSTTKVANFNADLLEGYHGSTTQAASTVVIRNSSGYIYTNYINSNTPVNENASIGQIITTNSSDNSFFRKSSIGQLRNALTNTRATLDLTALDANKWYPCSMVVSSKKLTEIRIWNSLEGDKPAWGSHTNGFTLNLVWQVSGDGWGGGEIQRKILNSYYSFAPSNPCGGIEQNGMASVEIVYLRGGAKYYYTTDINGTFTINSSGYSWASGDSKYEAPVLTSPKKDPKLCYESSILGVSNLYVGYIGTTVSFSNRLYLNGEGKIYPYSTSTRRAGMYGVYDSAKIGHIWSMGTSYQIPDDGANFGNLYGFAYKHTNNATGGTMATGHQAVWCENGTPRVAMGTNFWVANAATVGGVLTANTVTIKNTEVKSHLTFSRGSFNYITAPASGSIAFIVGGQSVGEATCDLIINNGSLYAGTTNATSLGKSDRRWSNTYTQLLNVAGAATLSSTLTVSGVLTASSTLNVTGIFNANNTTDATSTTAAGAVFDGGVGIAKQLRVGGSVTLGNALIVPYTGSSWLTLGTRTNIIQGTIIQTETQAHGLYRVKSYGGHTVTFGGLGNVVGFYGIYKATIDAGTNRTDWGTTWNTTTGKLTHNKDMDVSGILGVGGVVNANSTTDSTSTTTGSIVCDGGVGIAKQLRVGGATTLSSTLSVAGIASFTNATDATSTTAAGVKVTGGLGVAKQLRVGGTSTFTGKTTHNGGISTTTMTMSSTGDNVLLFTGAAERRIHFLGDREDHWARIQGLYAPVPNVGHNIQLNIQVGIGAIQLSSTNGTLFVVGQNEILASGVLHNTTGMYSDGYMSSKGLNDDSDMRLKNKVRDIFLSVKDIANAPAFEYTWKDGTPGVMAGSSAQYWQKVLSCSVREKKDGYLSMFYGHTAMVGLISLARHHESLEQRVARLEKENKEKDKTIEDLNQKYITLKNMYYGKSDSAC